MCRRALGGLPICVARREEPAVPARVKPSAKSEELLAGSRRLHTLGSDAPGPSEQRAACWELVCKRDRELEKLQPATRAAMARGLAALALLLVIAGARAADEDVVTVSGGLKQLEELVKKHPNLVVEVSKQRVVPGSSAPGRQGPVQTPPPGRRAGPATSGSGTAALVRPALWSRGQAPACSLCTACAPHGTKHRFGDVVSQPAARSPTLPPRFVTPPLHHPRTRRLPACHPRSFTRRGAATARSWSPSGPRRRPPSRATTPPS